MYITLNIAKGDNVRTYMYPITYFTDYILFDITYSSLYQEPVRKCLNPKHREHDCITVFNVKVHLDD